MARAIIHRGTEHIAGMRLEPKGLYRWYASCCKTPLGNTLSPSVPFAGIVARAFEVDGHGPTEMFGEPLTGIQGKFAIGTPPKGSDKLNVRLLARAIRLLIGWKLTRKGWPNAFFDKATRAPKYAAKVLTTAERDALRPLCGPHPSSASRT